MKQIRTSLLSLTLCILLIAASALCLTSCQSTTPETPQSGDQSTQTPTQNEEAATPDEDDDAIVIKGVGDKSFSFTVVDGEGNETLYTIKTDKTTVGDALLELGLIEGDESEYWLYVKKVDGISADFEANGTYWAFYVGGEYALSSVDTTEITDGASYAFKVERG
ncbi:MAG: DUF4430 domain-containing protein [Clostridia bacterium]|nr:DUF4430 domain-containing protein [Clostridia bacterium]